VSVDGAWTLSALRLVGLALALLGGATLLACQRALDRVVEDLPPEVAGTLTIPAGRAIFVIGAALGISFVARSWGHSVLGILTCVGILWVNAAVVARAHIRWIRAQAVEPSLSRRYQGAATIQGAAAWVSFGGCAIYLLW